MKMMQPFSARTDTLQLQEKMQRFTTRIDAMQLRERVLLLCAGVATLFILIDTFSLQPAFEQQEQSKLEISSWQQQLAALQDRPELLSSQSGNDPIESRQRQRDQLHEELSGLDDSLRNRFGALLAPEQAVQVLEQVLEQEPGLKLSEAIAVRKPQPGPEAEGKNAAPVTGIGRYELQLQLEGSYPATLRYLHALEALPWEFFWDGLHFEVIKYPTARVKLDIHTLGLSG
jgi:MSHA biogenesis protein MshJ